MLTNLPNKWSFETDLVAVGSGIGGLGAAITAHDHGASAVVLERADKIGGVTAVSMGEVWVPGNHPARALGIEDSAESGFRYLKRLSLGYGDEMTILNIAVHAPASLDYFKDRIGLEMEVIRGCPDYYYGFVDHGVPEGRLLEPRPFSAAALGEWQQRTRVSPLLPYALTHADISSQGGTANMAKWDYSVMAERLEKDVRCLGSGLAAYFVKGVIDRGIPIHTGMNVVELICDGTRVVGVRAVKDGKDIFIRANRGVVVAVSGYERNTQLNKTLGQRIDLESMVFSTIDGANVRLGGPAGARIASVPDITMLGAHVPGEEHETGEPLWRSVLTPIGLPHTIVVNRAGQRFGNELFYRAISYEVGRFDGATQTHPNVPCWAILDSQAREKYPFCTVMPGGDFPQGFGVKADTLAGLAGKIGVNPEGLVATVERFNPCAEQGEDPEFQRGTHPWSRWACGDPFHKPHPNLGPISKPPFYAVELHKVGTTAVSATGIVIDQHCRAVGWDDQPIDGLYIAGNSVARLELGAGFQSGLSNARGMVHGYLAGLHAAGQPSDLLQKEVRRLGL